MNKKDMKKIQVVEVAVHNLRSGQEQSGEWVSYIDIDFIIDTPQTFTIFDKTYVIDRIKMLTYYDELVFRLATKDTILEEMEVSKIFVHKIHGMLDNLQKEGEALHGWALKEDVFEILCKGDGNYAINHYPKKQENVSEEDLKRKDFIETMERIGIENIVDVPAGTQIPSKDTNDVWVIK